MSSDRHWKIVKRDRAFDGFFKMDQLTIVQQTPAGDWTEPYEREIFLRGDAVGVLPYDPIADKIVLTEQFRAALALAIDAPFSVEIPAGIIDPDETAETCAIRETKEETGCTVTNLELVTDYFTSPGGSTERVKIYCGKVDASQAVEIAGEASENEFIRVFSLSFDDAVEALEGHRFTNGMTISALFWLRLNRDRLRDAWAT